ncbi:hypothetical protein ACXWTF_03930 [Thiomicrolovo sp. ZZH C-3]
MKQITLNGRIWRNLLAAGVLLGGAVNGLAWEKPHATGQFELDGNILSEAAVPGDDWQDIANGLDSAFSDSGIIADGLGLSIFTGGGSKDVRNVNQWRWTDGSVPDKDEILHSAAAAYNANGELIVYLMGDRYSTDGSAQMGVWFFQDRVAPQPDGTFSGTHKNGDVLMLAEFVQGGAQAHVKLYEWDTTQKDNLKLIFEGQGGGDNYYFATSNGSPTEAWDTYTPKSLVDGMPEHTYPENSFFEGGINLSWIFENAVPCFSSFLMETRSSHRVNAQLKDFVSGNLDTCKLSISKTCLSSELERSDYITINHTFEYTVTNEGFGSIDRIEFHDNAGTPDDPNDDPVLSDMTDLATGESRSYSYTVNSYLNPPTNTITATGYIGEYAMAPETAQSTCQKITLNPAISITKTCKQKLETLGGHVVVRVDYQGRVCNEQNGTLLTNVHVTDDKSGSMYDYDALYPADDPQGRTQCENFGGTYYPTAAVSECAIENQHSNTVVGIGTEPLNGTEVRATATSNCPLCDEACVQTQQQ